MRTWTATTTTAARPQDVLEVLTDPEACAGWAPLPFDVDELDGRRLAAGSRARVSGKLAGRRVGFDVEVHEASGRGLSLAADGPVGFDVAYELAAVDGGSEVRASVSVRPSRGIAGRLLAEATSARAVRRRPRSRGLAHCARGRRVKSISPRVTGNPTR